MDNFQSMTNQHENLKITLKVQRMTNEKFA